ncbi:hypothetical protein FVR03_18780 [Pontibacter qinzhouensis]|uniref:DUF3945 domain-containing protein n=1 Tax=Pontibacter qinzhouensis TaxID=2603253 RepID=A0A5C8J792_9BACT|nr:hypothetical protein [Pontibacter qinzhouensis]TXK33750.1 hypothetical protein FVR03_18780 [Pontibacter qinzhouensis]
MNENNLDYLKEGLKYLGFGQTLNEELEKQVRAQKPVFELQLQKPYFNSTVNYTLHFRKSDQSDLYFFNKYDATLKPDASASETSQTFYLHKNSGITSREAYNLLEGRAVHKDLVNAEGQSYKAWLQLDLGNKDPHGNHKVKQYHENYGFDLEKTLQPYAIKELQDPQQKEQLLRSLQRGNTVPVTALQEGREAKHYLEANPQFKTLQVYNEHHKPVKRESIQLKQETSPAEAIKQQVAERRATKQEASPEERQEPKRSRKKGMSP